MFSALAILSLYGCTPGDDTDKHDTGHDDHDTGNDDTGNDDTGNNTGDTGDTGGGRLAIASETDGALTVEVWADEALHVGLNAVGFRVLGADGAPVDGLTLAQAPLMDMGDMVHSCPYTQPVGAGDGWYESGVVFIMGGTWANTVTISGGATGEVAFAALDVGETGMQTTLMAGGAMWMVTFDIAGEPVVGDNPFVLTVHAMMDPLTFPPVPDLPITVEPFMPDMGHGSEGNIDPVYVGEGRYEGTAVFSMGGAWEVTFEIADGSGGTLSAVFNLEI